MGLLCKPASSLLVPSSRKEKIPLDAPSDGGDVKWDLAWSDGPESVALLSRDAWLLFSVASLELVHLRG